MRGAKRPLGVVTSWVRRQPPKVKAFLAVVTGMAALVFIRFIVHDHDNLFVAAEAAHALGIGVLIYKLTKEKTCAGSFPSASLTPVPDLSRSPVPAPIGYRIFFYRIWPAKFCVPEDDFPGMVCNFYFAKNWWFTAVYV
jgi:hypothetical protein